VHRGFLGPLGAATPGGPLVFHGDRICTYAARWRMGNFSSDDSEAVS
jgi:hypothetical protein